MCTSFVPQIWAWYSKLHQWLSRDDIARGVWAVWFLGSIIWSWHVYPKARAGDGWDMEVMDRW